MKSFAYVLPESIDQASQAAKEKGAILKAGGIDVLDLMKSNLISPDSLVNILSITGKQLREIAVKEDGIHIGALVTLAQLAASTAVPPAVIESSGKAATPQIRNVATIAGNLAQRPRCWWFRSSTFDCARKGGNQCYAQKGENKYHAVFDNTDCAVVHPSSVAPALLALGATVVTNQRKIPMGEFFVPTKTDITKEHVLQPGEIITEIVIPASAKGWKTAYREAGEKDSNDWSLVSVAVALDLDGDSVKTAKVVLGQVAAVPFNATAAEAALAGKRITPDNAAKAAEAAFAKATPLADNGYKIALGKVILKRAILAAAGQPEIGG